MKILGVIPARLRSTRLPGKVLLSLGGRPLFTWAAQRLQEMGVCARIAIATDSGDVAQACARHGLEAVITSDRHRSGTERIAEVLRMPQFRDYGFALNVQADEPFVSEEAVRGAVGCLERGDPIGTAAGPLDAPAAADPSRVKVVLRTDGRAAYFSRAAIPYDRDGSADVLRYQHVGVYAYTGEALERWVRLPPVPAESWEQLEQLRPLLHGIPIGVGLCSELPARGIDTPEDFAWAQSEIERRRREMQS